MLVFFIKNYFLYLCSAYISLRIINYNLKNISQKLGIAIFLLLLTLLSCSLYTHIAELTYIIPMLLFYFYTIRITLRPQVSFISSAIAFGISYGLLSLTGCISLILMYPIYHAPIDFPYALLALVSGILQLLLAIGIFHIKRFQKGMPFLFSSSFINIATVIALLIIIFFIFKPSTLPTLGNQLITIFLFITIIPIIIFWWQAQLTKSYKHSLELRELESLRTELEEKDKKLAELSAKNEQLGRLIHKDNKLIPALENAVCEYLVTDFENNEEALAKGNSLLLEIREFSNNRANVITEISANKCTLYSTGITSLDTLLNYMSKRAQQDNIQFSVHFGTELDQHIPQALSVEDLVHLLSDLLENALIATTGSANPVVQLQFYQFKKHLVLEVSDNGIPFETASIVNFGLEQLTTHADAGGSGIGLMDIWNIKEKYGASLHIDEYETPSPYAKKISLTFNKKRHYSVRTWRKAEIDQASRRIDLQTFDYKK